MEGHVFKRPNRDENDMSSDSNPSNDNKRIVEAEVSGDAASGKMGGGGWVAVFVLGGFLVLALWYAVRMWGRVPDVGIPASGWVFLILGVVVTFLTGAGLMALVFYSSRNNRDF